MSQSWPLVLSRGELTLRPLRYRDRNRWLEIRRLNRDWLKPWEATSPFHSEKDLPSFFEMVNFHNREGRAGRALTLALWRGHELIEIGRAHV